MTALYFASREAFPNIRTVDYWLGDNKEERYPQSRTMEAHNKADGWQRRLEVCISNISNPGAVSNHACLMFVLYIALLD